MPVELDIAGNFAAGQAATLARRRSRQVERAMDYGLAEEEENLLGRRDAMRMQEELYGLDPFEFSDLQTNKDPWFQRLGQWWKSRRASRRYPSRLMPEQQQSIDEEAAALGYDPQEEEALGFNNGGMVGMAPRAAIPMAAGAATGMAPRARPRMGGRTAIPRLQDGGRVMNADRRGGSSSERAQRAMSPERRRARQNEFRRMGIDTRVGPQPQQPGMIRRAGQAVGRAGRAIGRVGRAIPAATAVGTIAPQLGENYDERIESRFGMGAPTPEEGDPSVGGYLRFLGRRGLGYASDLGNVLTGGIAGHAYRDNQEGEAGAIPGKDVAMGTKPPQEEAMTNEDIAQEAIAEGTAMAEEVAQQTAPPGAVDFSKVDFEAGDIPSMPVKDWVEYRAREVRNLMAQGASSREAHDEVTKMQQQSFLDYAQQGLMHLQAGNPNAAATALRAAYQYFPNGTDVRVGVQMGADGQPVLVGAGTNEETGEPAGQPMILNSERLAVMIENFSNPNAFTTWTKDWRDEQFERQQYEEVEKPEAESEARYRQRMSEAAVTGARADVVRAQNAGDDSNDTTLQQARQVFEKELELLGFTDPELANELAQVFIVAQKRLPNAEPEEIIVRVLRANATGKLGELKARLGLE